MVATRDRAQLILIGGIVIAFMVLGIALVVNSVLFIENADVSESSVSLGEASKLDAQVTRSTRSVVLRVNHRTRDHDSADLKDFVSGNLTGLSGLLTESYVESQSTSVQIEYDHGPSRLGGRIVQTTDGELTSPVGAPTWPVTNPGSGGDKIGWFVLNLHGNVGSSGLDQPFGIRIQNGSGTTIDYVINQTNGSTYRVESNPSYASPTTVKCTTQNDRLFLNLKRGASVTDTGCRFNGTEEVQNVSFVQFTDGDHVDGKFAVVTNEPTPGLGFMPQCGPLVPGDDPCSAPVVWTANVTIETTGTTQRYTKQKNITVYQEEA